MYVQPINIQEVVMSKNQRETFLSSLEEWEKESKPWVYDKSGLAYMLNGFLGLYDENIKESMSILSNRINELVDVINLDEDFLITSLSNKTRELLLDNLANHGSAIIKNEEMLQNADVVAEKINANYEDKEKYVEMTKNQISRLKRPDYIKQAQLELDVWDVIVAKNLSGSKRKEWENDRLQHILSKR
jgi:hypothetical protein